MIAASVRASAGTIRILGPYRIAPSTDVKVRVSDVADATVYGVSANPFSIKGTLTLTSPNGGEVWVVGTTDNITWTELGSIANVALSYSTDGGVTYPVGNITASTSAGTGSYPWTIPDAIGTTLKVKVTDTNDATVFATSAANFTIKGSITVTAPNGGEVWIVGQTQNITWTKAGSFANVELQYSTDGFSDGLQTTLITASTLASPLSYAWTVPNAIGTDLKVRVSDAADSTVTSTSVGTFTIKGALQITAPNGGEVWIVGSTQNITWNRTGSIANVGLAYSTDGGFSYPNTITTSTDATTGTYAWTIPDSIGIQLRVRVMNTLDATVYSASAANFTIKGSLTVTSPSGGEAWVVANSYNITWTKTGTISTVKLEYSTDAFSDELQTVQITPSVDATLGTPYSWTIPDAISSTVKVRVTNNADTTVKSISATNFKIEGSFTVTSPHGGEQWTVGTQQTITWTKVGTIANAKLEYSTDGGATYPYIIVTTPAGGLSYVWTIPDTVSVTSKVGIADASDATVFAVSSADFAIRGAFTITAPNGGEVWTVGTSQNITWTTVGSVSNVELEYSTDGGTTYPNTIVATTPNTGSYAWTIPNAISSTLKVKINDVNNSQAFATSSNDFKIRGALSVTAPNGSEQWTVGTSQNITWTTTGTISNVKLEYSTDGFSDELKTVLITASTSNTNSYAWTIPNAIGSSVKVRVTNVADSTVYAVSSANFTIRGALTITAPNGGEVWIVGQVRNITWTEIGSIVNVQLQYSTDGFSDGLQTYLITASTPSSSLSYPWTIPDAIGNTVKVSITDTSNSAVTAMSNANFSIKGSLTVTAPNGGEVWIVGTQQNITWTETGTFPNVELQYSTDGGNTYPNLIIASTPTNIGTYPSSTTGSYAWTIPDAIGTTLRVEVSNVSDSSVNAVSSANFTIKGSFSIISPNGGEVWIVGSSHPITWSVSGSIANVNLAYSTDGGVTYPNVITTSTSAPADSYSWTIPDAISTTARVMITNTLDSTVFTTSAANFAIKGSLAVTSPNGGESWSIGSSQNITWTKTGSIANVELQYSTDGGNTYPNLIVASVGATAGTPYAWTIPNTPSTTARVEVSNTSDATVFATSNGNFDIHGSLTMVSPNGGEIWVVGQSHNITWTMTGSIANAKLAYSTDGGANYSNVIIASTPAASLSYPWTVPDAIGTQLRVQIIDVIDATVSGASSGNFQIKGSVALTSPVGGEVWIVGQSQNITWNSAGSIGNAQLAYSTDGGNTYPNIIVASTNGTAGTYAWTVADAIGTTLRVQISDLLDPTVTSASPANFTIKGALAITAPVGGETWIVASTDNITWSRTGSIANVQIELLHRRRSKLSQSYCYFHPCREFKLCLDNP